METGDKGSGVAGIIWRSKAGEVGCDKKQEQRRRAGWKYGELCQPRAIT